MLYALIMAGGSGTRFWPASRRDRPKQLLPLASERTMIQSTVDRLQGLVDNHRVLVMTNQRLVEQIAAQLPAVPPARIIGEPAKRDTAPCIGLAAELIAAEDPDAVMLVLPSDHVIRTVDPFQEAVRAGSELIAADPSLIVTFGIKPTYPAESFGYIQAADSLASAGTSRAFRVAQFREKPDRRTAERYVADGGYYWNSGIFMWRASTVLAALRQHQPQMAEHLAAIGEAVGQPVFDQVLRERYCAVTGRSIDYAVMEHYQNVAVIEAPFPWDDVGSWQALSRMHPADENGNTVRGSHIGIDTKGSIIESSRDHTIVTIGVDDLIIVHTADATLVAPKHAEERVREAVQEIERRGRDDLL